MSYMQSDLALRLEAYLLSPALFAAGIRQALADAPRLLPDVLHAHWVLPNGFIGAVAARRLGIPLAVSVPGSDARNGRDRSRAERDALQPRAVEDRSARDRGGGRAGRGSVHRAAAPSAKRPS